MRRHTRKLRTLLRRKIAEQHSLKTLLDLATEDVLHPGKHVTFLEALGRKSVAHVQEMRKQAAGD